MPPLPKRKLSASKQRSRAAHYKAQPMGIGECAQCHQPKLLHRVCPSCGYYKGREVIAHAAPERG
ncbi:MAG: 50S ribosomal protein L32 [Dehalococcoidia bacterium]|nr:50S ribosomal protein L32 [Dehalococcoidia bacterium]